MSFVIVAVSLVLNFLIPYSYFLYITKVKGESFVPYKAINEYLSGMVGDTILVPLINLFLFKSVYGLPVSLSYQVVTLAFLMGLGAMAISHVSQAMLGPINWSMPEPWRWTFPGKYHMLSATIQYSYMALMLISVFLERSVVSTDAVHYHYFLAATLAVFLFLGIYALDYRKKE